MADKRAVTRMGKELERLKKDPPHGITCWSKDGMLNHLEANLLGGEGTPYEGGVFKLEITIPNRYPFEPPDVHFLTKIYHPNIDTAGRICLDVLKSPPTGSWKPAHNIHTILTSIQLLLAEPNPDDGLMAEISSEYKHQRPTFLAKAKEWTHRYAKSCVSTAAQAELDKKGVVEMEGDDGTIHKELPVQLERDKGEVEGSCEKGQEIIEQNTGGGGGRGLKRRKASSTSDRERLEPQKRKHINED